MKKLILILIFLSCLNGFAQSKISFNPRLGFTELAIKKDFPNDNLNEGTWFNGLKSISRAGSFGYETYYFSENATVVSCSLIPFNFNVSHDIVEDCINKGYKQTSANHWIKFISGYEITVLYDSNFRLGNGEITDCWIFTKTKSE